MSKKCPGKKQQWTFPKNFTLVRGQKLYLNPGTISNLHRQTRDIMPEYFDGINFTVKKAVATNKTLLASWVLSHNYPSGFRFGGIYHYGCNGNVTETPTIHADINPTSLSSNMSCVYFPIDQLKLEAKFQNLGSETRNFLDAESLCSVEYSDSDSTFALSTYTPGFESGRVTLSYLRSMTDKLSVGTEMLIEWMDGDWAAKTALAGRYSTHKWSIAASASLEGLDITYWQRINSALQMGTALAFNKNTRKAIGSISYQWIFKGATVRGMVDSDWAVGVMYQRTLQAVSCLMGFSIVFCIPSNRFGYGIKFEVDPGLTCYQKCNFFEKNI